MSVRVRLLVALTSLVAAVGYLGAVTPRALLVYVLPASAFGSLAAASARAGRLGSALLLTLVVGGGWAVLVNVLSGDTQGPAARSSGLAALLSGLAVVLVQTRVPTSFLLPSVGVLAGALGLGAGGEVRPVAVAAVIPAVLALRAVDGDRGRWLLPPGDRVATSLGLLLALLAAAAALQLPDPHKPLVLFPAQADPAVRAGLPDLVARTATRPTPRPTPGSSPTERPSPGARATPAAPEPAHPSAPARSPTQASPVSHRLRDVLRALLLLLVLAVLMRLLLVRLAWRRLRRGYDTGDNGSRTAGAWLWVRARLEGLRVALPPGLSPDSFDAGSPPEGVPSAALQALAELAPVAAHAEFSPSEPDNRQRAQAWEHAEQALALAERQVPRLLRLRIHLRGPGRR